MITTEKNMTFNYQLMGVLNMGPNSLNFTLNFEMEIL